MSRVQIVALALFSLALVHCQSLRDPAPAPELAAKVRGEFLHAWQNYERYAWGHDALRPLSQVARTIGMANRSS